MRYDSNIFSRFLLEDDTIGDLTPHDIFESIHFSLNDDNIDRSECSLIAYGMHVNETDETKAYNQKNNPDKAIDIFFKYPKRGLEIEVFLDTPSREWNSSINVGGRLSPEQMSEFFKTRFFSQLKNKMLSTWPESDPEFGELRNAFEKRIYMTDCVDCEEEQLCEWERIKRRQVKLGTPNEKDAQGNKIRSSSGRKLINFSDMGVSKEEEAYYSWPGGTDDKHIFKWSRWNNWENQKPFLRCRFGYNVAGGSSSADVIGLSLSLFPEDDKNRGFISYDLSLIPTLQYLTPDETQEILNLSIVRRFLKECVNRIIPILQIPDEEIFERIGNPEKCTLEDVRKTKRIVSNTMKAVRDPRVNTFIY